MEFFIILIIFSLSFYIFYKIKTIRSKKTYEKKWLSAKSSVALGSFVALFGINRIFISQTPLSITISMIFIVVGSISVITGYRAYKFYLPYVEKESDI